MTVKVIHTVGALHPEKGGPSRTVPSLCGALADMGEFDIRLIAQHRPTEPIVQPMSSKLRVDLAEASSRLSEMLGLPMYAAVHRSIKANRPDILHDHGIWLPSNHHVAAASRRYGIPFAIHPRGMLTRWALGFRANKKRLALLLYQMRDLQTAALFFVTAESEASDLRQTGLRQPIAIIPNGMTFSNAMAPQRLQQPPKAGVRTAVFLSRIHPTKGILNLVSAWATVSPGNWRLLLAGPDEGGHLAEVMQAIKKHKAEGSIEYIGPVDDSAKTKLLLSSHLFILPSYSESFGVVVLEALAHGLPVITTKGTPWKGLEGHSCGWWIDVGVEPLEAALRQALRLEPPILRAMGERGRAYAQRFNLTATARQTAEVYRWLLHRGDMPACVQTAKD
jgi:glycosyltransferase involved in cell wall biosynthesis